MLLTSITRFITLAICLSFYCSLPVLAQNTIHQYFQHLEGYQFEKLEDRPVVGDTSHSPFKPEIIEEFILSNYSLWSVQAYEASSRPTLELEVYEMKDPQGAFAMFSNWHHSSSQRPFLTQNYYINESLIFWKGLYFIHLKGRTPTFVKPDILERFVRVLNGTLPEPYLQPVTVTHLPQAHLLQGSISFYLGKASFSLNNHFPRTLVSSLGLEHDIEIASARYVTGKSFLYLVGYPTPSLAAEQSDKLQNAVDSHFSSGGVYVQKSGIIVSIFFGSESVAEELFATIQYAPTIKWIYRKEKASGEAFEQTIAFLGTVSQNMITILTFIPILLLMGCAAGLIRYTLFQRFPGIQDRNEMIQLGIAAQHRHNE